MSNTVYIAGAWTLDSRHAAGKEAHKLQHNKTFRGPRVARVVLLCFFVPVRVRLVAVMTHFGTASSRISVLCS